jgi:hypothetical protein
MMSRTVLLLVLLLGTLASLGAEIAPEEYQKMQLSSEEHLEILVRSVSKKSWLFSRETNVTVNAEVMVVHRSRTGLREGDQITIAYTHSKLRKGWAGPRPIPILKRKSETSAFLSFDERKKVYVPSARGYSFESLIIPALF